MMINHSGSVVVERDELGLGVRITKQIHPLESCELIKFAIGTEAHVLCDPEIMHADGNSRSYCRKHRDLASRGLWSYRAQRWVSRRLQLYAASFWLFFRTIMEAAN